MEVSDANERLCACGCGTPVKGTWARGHYKRNAVPLIGETPGDVIDLGEATITTPPPSTPETAPPPAPSPPPPPDEDLGPAHARRDWHKPAGPGKGKGRPPRITATVRSDINAKISMPLEIFGRIWWARDPWCGGTFMEQRPAVADALTEIVCQSADLVQFFTGTGGGFMLYLNLGAALWPVAEVAFAHHVSHSLDEQKNPHEPAQPYAA